MGTLGFEPKTCGLKVQCSTNWATYPYNFLLGKYYNAKRIKNAIINEKRAIASVNANPRIAVLNNSSFKEGFREIPITNAPNTVPIPTPAPASPIVAKPAPINLAACNNM